MVEKDDSRESVAPGQTNLDGAAAMAGNTPIAVSIVVGPTMRLRSGAWFDLLDPHGSDFDIEDIAHGLAHVCRYAGQCNDFYSVAEHSLLVSQVCAAAPLAGLMHDAAEAFIGDVVRPLKQLLPDYKNIERAVEAAVFERFGLSGGIPRAVKDADLEVLAAEQAQIMPQGTADWAHKAGIVPAKIRVRHLAPAEAKREFLQRFTALSGLSRMSAKLERQSTFADSQRVTRERGGPMYTPT